MDTDSQHILTALTLILAKQMKAEKEARGISTTSNMTAEAADLIKQSRVQIATMFGQRVL